MAHNQALPQQRHAVACKYGLIALISGLLLTVPGPVSAEAVGIVATVNDGVITTRDLAERRALIMASSNIPVTPENTARVTPRVLQSLIDEALELQEAKRQSIQITPEEIAQAMDSLPAGQNQPPGSLKRQLEARGLSVRSLETQLEAQLAWRKVVQRKLRRNVAISQDEVMRAQQTAANAPDVQEVQLTALLLAPTSTAATQQEVQKALAGNHDIPSTALHYQNRSDIVFNPPQWVMESNLPPEVAQALSKLKPGGLTPPLNNNGSVQFLQLLDRRTSKPLAPTTEVTIKQITLALPSKPDKKTLANFVETERVLRKNPGSCDDAALPATPLPASAGFARVLLGNVSNEQRALLSRLQVGEVSDPLRTENKLRLVMLCERSEAASGTRGDETTRQQLFAEKLELEAQKHLRNLRRDAAIDVREGK